MRHFLLFGLVAAAAGVTLAACGARSLPLDDEGGFGGGFGAGNGAGAGIAIGSGASGTTGSPGATSGGAGADPASGSGASGTSGDVASSSGTGSDGTPIGDACAAFLDALAHADSSECAACLDDAPFGNCKAQIKATKNLSGDCKEANSCALHCESGDFCGCVERCLSGQPKKCTTKFANAFWCISGTCGADCS